MGRIKSLMVKRAAKKLIYTSADSFNSDFTHNKKSLGSTMPSKPIRNKIAGYIARMVKMKTNPRVIKEKPVETEMPTKKPYRARYT